MGDLAAMAPGLAALLGRLQLTPDRLLDENETFVILLCRGERDRRLVLKFLRSDSPDAHRRLRNEMILTRHLRQDAPLRLLTCQGHGPSHLITDFDQGELLQPVRLEDPAVRAAVVGALLHFQSAAVNPTALGVVDREPLSRYYAKVLVKNILHLWPDHLSLAQALRSAAALAAAWPAIRRRGVLCHGDLLPTNLLFHAEDGTVTFTDLEGTIARNHPLFDVIAHLTIAPGDVREWGWQRDFLREYLDGGGAKLGPEPGSPEFESAYRGILVFFLVYRLSEARLGLLGATYFEGLGRWRFVGRKVAELTHGRGRSPRSALLDAGLAVRRNNLERLLTRRGWQEHQAAMLARYHSGTGSAKFTNS
jgi:hypothetical protein